MSNPIVVTELDHVVLRCRDQARMLDFYTRVLGFRVSDWNEHAMVFLRCNTDHHAIAFRAAPHVSLNHVAYELQHSLLPQQLPVLERLSGRALAVGNSFDVGTLKEVFVSSPRELIRCILAIDCDPRRLPKKT